jgi:hypothetical protein
MGKTNFEFGQNEFMKVYLTWSKKLRFYGNTRVLLN